LSVFSPFKPVFLRGIWLYIKFLVSLKKNPEVYLFKPVKTNIMYLRKEEGRLITDNFA
jgi:hypothetical protein